MVRPIARGRIEEEGLETELDQDPVCPGGSIRRDEQIDVDGYVPSLGPEQPGGERRSLQDEMRYASLAERGAHLGAHCCDCGRGREAREALVSLLSVVAHDASDR